MRYQIAEKFKSLQGEGVYTGTPMAFIRFVGCSVGKKICNHCDTDFEKKLSWRGGGEFDHEDLLNWVDFNGRMDHICLTGGEPLDNDLEEFVKNAVELGKTVHIETSGTILMPLELLPYRNCLWICVSPKPGYNHTMIEMADELKIIVPGLGNGEGWMTLEDALFWAFKRKVVFLQPRNGKYDVDKTNLTYVLDLLRDHPELRLSVQMHKILKVQ